MAKEETRIPEQIKSKFQDYLRTRSRRTPSPERYMHELLAWAASAENLGVKSSEKRNRQIIAKARAELKQKTVEPLPPDPARSRERGVSNMVKARFNRHLREIGRRIPTDPKVYERLLADWLKPRPELLESTGGRQMRERSGWGSSKTLFFKAF